MHYMGGKFRQSKAIVAELMRRYAGQRAYVEPFCGAMGVAEVALPELARLGVTEFHLSDVSQAVITMWSAAVFDGWEPPDFVSEELYGEYRKRKDPTDPLTAYIGHACCFMGKWYGTYARCNRNARGNDPGIARMQLAQKRAVARKAAALRPFRPRIICLPYDGIEVRNSLVYLDPPYQDRTKGHNFGGFDYGHFWEWAAGLSKGGNDVIATEFLQPSGWETVFSWGDTVVRPGDQVSKPKRETDERIFELIREAV